MTLCSILCFLLWPLTVYKSRGWCFGCKSYGAIYPDARARPATYNVLCDVSTQCLPRFISLTANPYRLITSWGFSLYTLQPALYQTIGSAPASSGRETKLFTAVNFHIESSRYLWLLVSQLFLWQWKVLKPFPNRKQLTDHNGSSKRSIAVPLRKSFEKMIGHHSLVYGVCLLCSLYSSLFTGAQ